MCHIDFCLIIPILTPFCYYFVRGTFMQIEQELVNNRLHVSKVSWKSRIPNIYNFTVLLPRNFPKFLKVAYYFLLPFLFISKTLLSNKTGTAMNTKICAVFVICVETIIYLLLYNLHDCKLRSCKNKLRKHIEYNHLDLDLYTQKLFLNFGLFINVCLKISFGKKLYHIETMQLICIAN